MERFKRDREHSCLGSYNLWCDCGVLRGRRPQPCRPPWPILATEYYLCDNWREILPVEFVKKVRERNLRRLEPKEEEDGEHTELEDTKDEEGNDTEAPHSKFAGKKKTKAKKDGSNNALSASSFGLLGGLLGEGDDEDNENSGITKRMLIMKNQDNEVAGFAPCEKQITELLKVGKDERPLKVAKRKLGTHKRAKKHEEMAFVLRNMRAGGGGEKK